MGETYDEEHGGGGGRNHFGEKFFRYKQNINGLKDALEKHFTKVINEIEAGLPSVQVEETKEGEDEEDDVFKATSWTCITCTSLNNMNTERCNICRTKRPTDAKKKK